MVVDDAIYLFIYLLIYLFIYFFAFYFKVLRSKSHIDNTIMRNRRNFATADKQLSKVQCNMSGGATISDFMIFFLFV